MGKHERYLESLNKKHPNLEVIGVYEFANSRLEHRCKIHNYNWSAYPNTLLYGGGCPLCNFEDGKCVALDTELYSIIVENYDKSIKVIGDYINSSTPIKHVCKTHNLEFYRTPNSVVNKSIKIGNKGICPICTKNKRTTDSYNHELREMGISNIVCIGEYRGNKVKIKHYCSIHDYYWDVEPKSLMKARQCPICSKYGASKGEKRMVEAFNKMGVSFEKEKSFEGLVGVGGNSLRYDFAVYSRGRLKALIEYDGEFHYLSTAVGNNLLRQLEHDNIKSEYAKSLNVKLIRIPYWDFDNIDKILNYELKKLRII